MRRKRTIVLIVAFTTLALLCGTCGKSSKQAGTGLSSSPLNKASVSRSLDDLLAQIDAYEPPPEVDRAVFEKMRARIREAVITRWRSKGTSAQNLDEVGGNEVGDLWRYSGQRERLGLRWPYRNSGDYNQNGVVAIEDVTPVAVHYGESKAAGTWKSMTKSLMPAGSCSSIRAALWA
jgi:hypothetical protein